ncbi:c-type cytochrome [Frateuria terrea]|uniref:Cytochrome c553 n=1 Tax=Frateuria terrea TaxID=529704 RepID=A0A1H6SKQ1_9GAMM|nr:cytochrome c [Frateuria terrea]SEI68519.1 Cytochrome c553 [Frateuria terrea]SFP27130.1 Cytochrome c553 [Frateuria terrea]
MKRRHVLAFCLQEKRSRLIVLVAALFALTGCEQAMHDMYAQPKYKPLEPSPLFADGTSARTPPPGSVPMAQGAAADTASGRRGHITLPPEPGPALPLDGQGRSLAQGEAGERRYANPLPVTLALLQRGQQRFDIYCAPCHGRSGDGDGMIARRGFPAPPSYHTDRLRNAPDSHFYQVISNGYGVMYPYADRIDPHDRWAIVAYIRALQLSQHAPRGRLTPQDLARLSDALSARPEVHR